MLIDQERTTVGALIRAWRERRRLSQLDLASDAGISTRHLSFIETNRSKPSVGVLVRLGDRLDVPLGERNAMMLAAGYAPAYAATALDAPSVEPIRHILDAMLATTAPTVIVTRRWDLIDLNDSARIFTTGVADHLLAAPANALRIALHPEGMAPRIRNFDRWCEHALGRLRREARFTGDHRLFALLDELRAYGNPDATGDGQPSSPAIPLRFEYNGEELAFISTVATFGTPVDVTVSELMIETFHPINDAARRVCRERESARAID